MVLIGTSFLLVRMINSQTKEESTMSEIEFITLFLNATEDVQNQIEMLLEESQSPPEPQD